MIQFCIANRPIYQKTPKEQTEKRPILTFHYLAKAIFYFFRKFLSYFLCCISITLQFFLQLTRRIRQIGSFSSTEWRRAIISSSSPPQKGMHESCKLILIVYKGRPFLSASPFVPKQHQNSIINGYPLKRFLYLSSCPAAVLSIPHIEKPQINTM